MLDEWPNINDAKAGLSLTSDDRDEAVAASATLVLAADGFSGAAFVNLGGTFTLD